MKNYLHRIWDWVHGRFERTPVYRVIVGEELPDQPQPHKLYLVGDADAHWMAAMVCPCGCGDLIQLATGLTGRPRWDVWLEKGDLITLHPSVRRKVRCRSHFFVRHGKIVWC
jgi:hypothetical protein